MDIGTEELSQRKISITVQLKSDSDEYTGGELQLWPGGTYPIKLHVVKVM
jgi:hypothetical protein